MTVTIEYVISFVLTHCITCNNICQSHNDIALFDASTEQMLKYSPKGLLLWFTVSYFSIQQKKAIFIKEYNN